MTYRLTQSIPSSMITPSMSLVGPSTLKMFLKINAKSLSVILISLVRILSFKWNNIWFSCQIMVLDIWHIRVTLHERLKALEIRLFAQKLVRTKTRVCILLPFYMPVTAGSPTTGPVVRRKLSLALRQHCCIAPVRMLRTVTAPSCTN